MIAPPPIADNTNGEAVRIGLSAAMSVPVTPQRGFPSVRFFAHKIPVSPTLYFFINDDSAPEPSLTSSGV